AEHGVANPFGGSEAEAVDELDSLLRDSIRLQMVADVPLGAFLSGGIDSSTVVALMQAQSDRPVKTFSIGFYEDEYSEAAYAKAVARHLGTDHTELYVTPEEAMAVIPKLPALYDEPFSDSSQIPTYIVSELARKHVTVSLSGDGGDELFAGYNRYFWGRSIWNKIGWMPPALRGAAAGALTAISPQVWDRAFKRLGPILPGKLRQRMPGDRLHKLAGVLNVKNPEVMYTSLVSLWKNPDTMVAGGSEPPTTLTDPSRWADLPEFTHRMMYLDTMTYLPDDILVKVDRASMGVSLEGRIPFLDHRLVEFAWRVPLGMKIRDGQGKWLLRQVLNRYVPKKLTERPKMGFGVPIGAWLRGPLREWAEDLLSERRLSDEGFFDPHPIREKWSEHLSGRRNWQYHLWEVLMFEAWLEENRD
ncbi:MAG TPA: asparagine synthase C-terminal domain-containing protein, partial [Fimbriimonadaceae bacterium]|nr:asparagine synthase C-terminal domain-containing protein [Fimbriimonadaceae bacterium]